jgi:hypothetical protein
MLAGTVEAQSGDDEDDDQAELDELRLALSETRILLPGTQVFLGFLATLPFSQLFRDLDRPRRVVFVCTFFATLVALILFVVPAAYHRIARPIHDVVRFKELTSRFLVAGLVPMSISMVLASYLVAYVAVGGFAIYLASAIALFIATLWWVMPLVRFHDRIAMRRYSGSLKRQDEPVDASVARASEET